MSLDDEITRRALMNSVEAKVAVEAERDAAVAALERVREVLDWHVGRRFVLIADLRAALEEPS